MAKKWMPVIDLHYCHREGWHRELKMVVMYLVTDFAVVVRDERLKLGEKMLTLRLFIEAYYLD